MCVKQISVSLENEPGKFLEVSQLLGAEGINIRAISVADTADISTVRFVADNPEKTTNVLRSRGYSIRETDVIAVEIPDHPGGLQAILKPLKRADINVLYLYPYLGRGESGRGRWGYWSIDFRLLQNSGKWHTDWHRYRRIFADLISANPS